MAETANISKLANRISQELFSWFKWSVRPLQDVNWDCVSEHHHNKKTHPSDVVFHYEHPYTGKTIYLNTDLKSYKADSITKTQLEKALTSLSMSIECANISESWQTKFLLPHNGASEVIGLLFIYNHDGEFDKDLDKQLQKINLSQLNIKEKNKIIILEPKRITALYNVVHDLKDLVAERQMTRPEDYDFFYPDLVLSKAGVNHWSHAASAETITGPWLIIKHKAIEHHIREGYLIYYMRDGSQVDEFVYFLDALSRFQMLLGDEPIRIRLVNSAESAANNFDIARDKYLREWGNDDQRKQRLNAISIETIPTRQPCFNLQEIGMRQHD